MNIPATIGDVDPTWLNEVSGWSVDSIRAELIGEGIGVSSAVYRLHLAGDGPASAILKLTALDEAAVFTSTVLRMYQREVRFFEHFAADAPVRVPRGFGGAVGEDGASMFQLMEDLSGLRTVDQTTGMAIGDAEVAVDAAARWHAHYWGSADRGVDLGAVMALNDPLLPAVLPSVFDEGWAIVSEAIELGPSQREVGARYVAGLADLMAALDGDVTTFTHGDFRADNMLFDGSELVLVDFQLGTRASAAYDLAYFVTQSLTPDDASRHERALFARWVDGLHAGGVGPDATAGLWEDYRRAALFCVVYPMAASRQMDLTDERQLALLQTMMDGFRRVVDELGLVDLLAD